MKNVSKTKGLQESRPVVIFNTEKKELMGIFLMTSMVVKYLFATYNISDKNKVYRALATKTKIKNTKFDFTVAIRYANENHLSMLNGDSFKIMIGYPIPHYTKMNGFTSTKETLKEGFNERNNRRWKELKNKNSMN